MAKEMVFIAFAGLFLSLTVLSQVTIDPTEQKPAAESLRSATIPVRSIDPTDAAKQRNFGDYITLASDDKLPCRGFD